MTSTTLSPPPVRPAPVATVARLRTRQRRRAAVVGLVCLVATLAMALVGLLVGDAGVAPSEVAQALLGDGDPTTDLVVRRLRLPRVTGALVTGAAFGLGGALFQSSLRNPLASPDVLGIAQGASVGAVWAMLGLGLGGAAVTVAAATGALVVAAAIWLLAWRDGLHGIRFVLVGIGAAYLCSGVVAWLLARAEVRVASQALRWTVGDVADVRGEQLLLVTLAVTGLVVVGIAQGHRQRALALGDDHAHGLGVAATRGRSAALLVGVGLVAVATSVAGPVPFVALTAPAIARALLDDGGPALASATAVGAAMTLGADVVGQHLLPWGVTAPVGIVTGLLGAPYLLWLLGRRGDRRTT